MNFLELILDKTLRTYQNKDPAAAFMWLHQKWRDREQAMIQTGPVKPLKCPSCGNDRVSTIRYVEHVEIFRPVVGLGEHGAVAVDVRWSANLDEGIRPMWECMAELPSGDRCCTRWPVPVEDFAYIEWVGKATTEEITG